jgi:cupin 2 domain-containing protein
MERILRRFAAWMLTNSDVVEINMKFASVNQSGNLFANTPVLSHGEAFEPLLSCSQLRIERIISSADPDQQLYDQTEDEWVCLLQGTAQLWIAGVTVDLVGGDYYFIPAHTLHRVLYTTSEPQCIWLAIHLERDCATTHGDVNSISSTQSTT